MDDVWTSNVEGEIAVLIEAGAEKLRYITGHTTAFNSAGKRIDLDLGDISSKAARNFHVPVNKITTAEHWNIIRFINHEKAFAEANKREGAK